MNEVQSIVVQPLRDEFLEDVIRIHQVGLGYTLNSRLGKGHLAFLYQAMSHDNQSYVGVALHNNRPVGIVSGTTDAEGLKLRLLRLLALPRMIAIAIKLIADPRLIFEWLKGNKIGDPVNYEGKEVTAVLTAIAVDREFQSKGVGKQLVIALEKFFVMQDVCSYRLDTLLENQPAREFYRKLGFKEIEIRADSIIFVRAIGK